MIKVCHMTSAHSNVDSRIFYKECCSLKQGGYDVYLVAKGEPCVRDGITIISVPEIQGRLKRMFQGAHSVYKKALEIDADIYHFHDPELLPYGLKLKKAGKTVIYDTHEDVPRQILSKNWIPVLLRKSISCVFEKYENRVMKKMDFVIAATPHIAKRIRVITPHTIDINNYPVLNLIEMPAITDFRNRENMVCFTGRLSHIRGRETIIEAIKKTSGKLLLAGIYEDDVKGVPSQVEYLGIVPYAEVEKVLLRCKGGLVLYLPEPNHVAAQPLKLFEYMAAGIPVVASNFPLWKEIVEGNHCGICVDPEDVDATAKAISYLFEHPEEAQTMGENGRKAVVEKYNWNSESKQLLEIYRLVEKWCTKRK